MWYTGWVPESFKRNPNTICFVCKKPIYRRPSEVKANKGHVFCSPLCYGIYQRKEIPCVVCGKSILAGFNKKTCSRKCANINRAGIHYKIGRPQDKARTFKILKRRLLIERGKKCERCGYDRYQILHVHHKNRNRSDNRPENLEIICPNCHYEEHHLKRRQNTKSWKIS